MASGHPSFGTMHADSVDTMIKRLETPPISLSSSLVETMDVVLIMSHVKIKGKSSRRLREVVEVISVDDKGKSETNTPFMWDPTKDIFVASAQSHVFQSIMRDSGVSYEYLQSEFEKRTKLMKGLYEREVFEFHKVQQIINDYYKNPEKVLQTYTK